MAKGDLPPKPAPGSADLPNAVDEASQQFKQKDQLDDLLSGVPSGGRYEPSWKTEKDKQQEADPLLEGAPAEQPKSPAQAPVQTPASQAQPTAPSVGRIEQLTPPSAPPATPSPQVAPTPPQSGPPPTPAPAQPAADPRDAVIEQMRRTIAELSAGRGAQPVSTSESGLPTQPVQPVQPVQQPVQPQQQPAQVDFGSLIQQLGLDQQTYITPEQAQQLGVKNPDLLNQILGKVAVAGAEQGARLTFNVLPAQLDRQNTYRQAVTEFFQQHSDLLPYRAYVSHVANQIAGANPSFNLGQVFEAAATKVRSDLFLQQRAAAVDGGQPAGAPNSQQTPTPESPAFAPAPGGGGPRGRATDSRTPMQKEIDELIS